MYTKIIGVQEKKKKKKKCQVYTNQYVQLHNYTAGTNSSFHSMKWLGVSLLFPLLEEMSWPGLEPEPSNWSPVL